MNTESNPTCDLKCAINESETIGTLKKKLSYLDNKKNDLYREVNTVSEEMSKIRKDISNRYMTKFLNSKKVITETYFKYYSSFCKILELKNIFGDVISITALSVKFNSEICLDNFNLTWKEIFDNLITKESFEEELRKTIETLGLSDNLVQKIELKTEPDNDIWIQSSTNNFQIN